MTEETPLTLWLRLHWAAETTSDDITQRIIAGSHRYCSSPKINLIESWGGAQGGAQAVSERAAFDKHSGLQQQLCGSQWIKHPFIPSPGFSPNHNFKFKEWPLLLFPVQNWYWTRAVSRRRSTFNVVMLDIDWAMGSHLVGPLPVWWAGSTKWRAGHFNVSRWRSQSGRALMEGIGGSARLFIVHLSPRLHAPWPPIKGYPEVLPQWLQLYC